MRVRGAHAAVRVSLSHAPHPARPVPFEEDDRDSSIWFLDHSYHEQMYRMCRRINGAHNACSPLLVRTAERQSRPGLAAKEAVVGWYSTGPKIREARARADPAARASSGAKADTFCALRSATWTSTT